MSALAAEAPAVCTCPLCGGPIYSSGILVDEEGGIVIGNGRVVHLTRQEFAIFDALWSVRPRMVTRAVLMKALYGLKPEADEPEVKIIDVFVCKARAKLAKTGVAIETVWGTGYRITTGKAQG